MRDREALLELWQAVGTVAALLAVAWAAIKSSVNRLPGRWCCRTGRQNLCQFTLLYRAPKSIRPGRAALFSRSIFDRSVLLFVQVKKWLAWQASNSMMLYLPMARPKKI